METIKWVETPPCRSCTAPPEYRRRYPCLGCEKFRKESGPPAFAKHRLGRDERLRRNARIAGLHKSGYSYSQIALMLKMPRATVQSAAAAGIREKGEPFTV